MSIEALFEGEVGVWVRGGRWEVAWEAGCRGIRGGSLVRIGSLDLALDPMTSMDGCRIEE